MAVVTWWLWHGWRAQDLVAQKLEAAGGDESAASVQISVEDVHALFSSLKEKRRRLE